MIVKLQSSRRFVSSSSGHGIRNRCGSAFCNAVLNAHSQFSNTGRVLHLNDFSKLMRSFKKLQIFHVQSSYLKQRTNTNIQHAATSVQTLSLCRIKPIKCSPQFSSSSSILDIFVYSNLRLSVIFSQRSSNSFKKHSSFELKTFSLHLIRPMSRGNCLLSSCYTPPQSSDQPPSTHNEKFSQHAIISD